MNKLLFYVRKGESKYGSNAINRDVTIYLEKPKMDFSLVPRTFTLNMGISVCHPKDKFVKKDGRELAVARSSPKLFTLQYATKEYFTYMVDFCDFQIYFVFNSETIKIASISIFE